MAVHYGDVKLHHVHNDLTNNAYYLGLIIVPAITHIRRVMPRDEHSYNEVGL